MAAQAASFSILKDTTTHKTIARGSTYGSRNVLNMPSVKSSYPSTNNLTQQVRKSIIQIRELRPLTEPICLRPEDARVPTENIGGLL
jgi:hypothetical protein